MAKRKDGRSAADNMGRGSSDLVRVEKSRLAGQIPDSCLWDNTLYYVAINGKYRGKLFSFDGSKFLQQMFEPSNSDPQRVEYTITNGKAKAKSSGADTLAAKRRMAGVSQETVKALTDIAGLRGVHIGNRPARKQRAKPAMVGSRSKKASGRDIRR